MAKIPRSSIRVALVGNPNCGKTALFNALTGGRQKVANYPGVTVERKQGFAKTPSGRVLDILDLPGTYSLDARTLDERVTQDVLLGRLEGEAPPDVVIAVADATNLERTLGLVLEVKDVVIAQGSQMVLALNMMDLAHQKGMVFDLDILVRELGVWGMPTVAVKGQGIPELLAEIEVLCFERRGNSSVESSLPAPDAERIRQRFLEVDRILKLCSKAGAPQSPWTDRIDRIVLHPVSGTMVLFVVLFVVFQAIFNWAAVPQEWISNGIGFIGDQLTHVLSEGPLRSLLIDGVLAGVGSVLVFLPQILFLFFFILVLEDSGYMARAAFLMDRIMGRVGLHGRAFIPLLSSFACTVPGIMATRTIENRRDRLATILVAPLMTCSARLPVYSLLIAAFIPNREVIGPFRLQGLVMFLLYVAGIVSALGMAVVFRGTILRGPKPHLLMELPTYKWPSRLNLVFGLWERCGIFLKRAGTVILSLSVILWFLASYPKPPVVLAAGEAPRPAIAYSFAGQLGQAIEPLVRPIGFNWQIAVALIPGFVARETMITALGTVYAVEMGESKEAGRATLGARLAKEWSLATALSLIVWYVLACQCLSTLAVTRRETNSLKWPAVMLGYMTVLAYAGSFVTFHFVFWMAGGK
ncbi:ferrous iron transport protein B [Bdellovibrionota bacterium FG-2]